MSSSQSGWVLHVRFPLGAVLQWIWIRRKIWIYKCGIFGHVACFVLNLCSLACFFLFLFFLLSILVAVQGAAHCLNIIKQEGRRVIGVGERCNILLPEQYLGCQWWVDWKSGEVLTREKGKVSDSNLSMLEIRKSLYRQKIIELMSGFLWIWEGTHIQICTVHPCPLVLLGL